MNSLEKLHNDLADIHRIVEYSRKISEGISPFLLLDRQMVETYFPTQLRQALIDEVLKDLDDDNQLFNESSNTSNNSL